MKSSWQKLKVILNSLLHFLGPLYIEIFKNRYMASESWKSRIDRDNSVEVCCIQPRSRHFGTAVPVQLYAVPVHSAAVKRAGDRKRKIEAHGGARRRTFKDIEAAKYDSSDGERE